MSKIAQYLNEHLLGSVSGLTTLRKTYASDASVLEMTPELVVYPKVTNDIRKVARFSWQLAEKGHVLSLTPRGLGGDTTGGAIGPGLVIDTAAHLNSVLHVAARDKNRIVHVQPGASLRTLHEVLRWNGMTIGAYTPDMPDMTIGGAIAGGVMTRQSGKYGMIADAIDRMEVVLANGDLMELGRVNKREVSKKQGQQTLEGEIYRQVDGLIEEHAELIGRLSSSQDTVGYRIDQVKQKDGSFDLTPLFVGSQGTLGIISEIVLKTSFYSDEESAVVVPCKTSSDARDVADVFNSLDPASVLMIDAAYFDAARTRGKRFLFDEGEDKMAEVVVYASFDDLGDKARERKLKRAVKQLAKNSQNIYSSVDYRLEELQAVRDVEQVACVPLRADETFATICDGAYVPLEQLGEFEKGITALAEKHRVKLPLQVDMQTGVVSTKPTLHLKKIADKQKVFKLATDYAALVHRVGGSVAGSQAEGRLGAYAAYQVLDADVVELNAKIRKIFDPFGTLNPGIKQQSELKSLVKLLKSE